MTLDTSLHLHQTQAFIDERPIEVVITRKEKVTTAAGGYRWANPEALPPQVMRLVEMLRIQGRESRMDSDGKLVVPTHIAVMMPDSDIQIHDSFPAYDGTWEVVWVSKLPEWRWQAEVVGRG